MCTLYLNARATVFAGAGSVLQHCPLLLLFYSSLLCTDARAIVGCMGTSCCGAFTTRIVFWVWRPLSVPLPQHDARTILYDDLLDDPLRSITAPF